MILGIDIGGTGIQLGIVDESYHIVRRADIPTGASRGADAIVRDIIAAAKPLCGTYHPIAVGIGCAGRIDPPNGTVLRAGHLPFKNEPLCRKLSDALAIPAYIENDANCALLAEATVGACRDCRDALMVTIGTGIGGAILIGGAIYRAHNFRAGELGHFIFDYQNGAPCPCGLHGCFEQYASATALIERATAAAEAAPDSLLAGYLKAMNGKAVFRAAAEGCSVANEVLAGYGEILAMGLNSFVKIFMPECIVLAGGIAKAGDALLDRITPHLLPEATLRVSALGGDAGLLGAALVPPRI